MDIERIEHVQLAIRFYGTGNQTENFLGHQAVLKLLLFLEKLGTHLVWP